MLHPHERRRETRRGQGLDDGTHLIEVELEAPERLGCERTVQTGSGESVELIVRDGAREINVRRRRLEQLGQRVDINGRVGVMRATAFR